MANLNLSEFGEKLFVADADHTFIWDSAESISKRVSRNSWLNSGTLTSDAPVTISQTWNGTGSTVFKALVVNATTPGTTSASGSLLLDLQVGTVSQFSVSKAGGITASNALFNTTNARSAFLHSIQIGSSSYIGFTANYNPDASPPDTILLRDGAANTLALRNGAAAQTFRVYNTYTDASNYERGLIGWVGGIFEIGSQAAGTGATRHTRISSVNTIAFATSGIERWRFSSAGNLTADADNTYDIGASGANRPRNVYVGNSIVVGVSNGLSGGITTDVGVGRGIIFGNRGQLSAIADGHFNLIDFANTGFNRFSYGGTTSGYPALKRVGAELQVVIASTTSAAGVAAPDADLTFIEDRYRRKGAGSPNGVVTAPVGAVYHCTDGGANTSFYVKESGTGNTGWVGK